MITGLRYNNIGIEIVKGDIAAQATDAIVNAANNHLWMGSGVAGAIKRNGGAEIEAEAMAQGPIAVGESVLTKSGTLPSKFVIHAACMGQDLQTDEAKISNATKSSLKLAEQNNLSSISLPAFGTGVGGFSLAQCASIMVGVVIEMASALSHLKTIRFVLFGEDAFRAFAVELEKHNIQ